MCHFCVSGLLYVIAWTAAPSLVEPDAGQMVEAVLDAGLTSHVPSWLDSDWNDHCCEDDPLYDD